MSHVRIHAVYCARWWIAFKHGLNTARYSTNTMCLTRSVYGRHENNTPCIYTRLTPMTLNPCTRHLSVDQSDDVPKKIPREEKLGILVDGLLQHPEKPTHEGWVEVGDRIESLMSNPKHWPSVVMKIFVGRFRNCEQQSAKRTAVAKSLLDFTRHIDDGCTDQRRSRVTIALLTSYMNICGQHLTFSKAQDTKAEAHIMNIFSEVKHRAQVYDSESSSAIIEALCATTGLWQQSLDILDMMKDVYLPSESHLVPIIAAAYRENCIEVAHRLLPELVRSLREKNSFTAVLNDRVVKAVLDKARQDGHPGSVLDLLRHMKENQWLLSTTITSQFISYYKSIPTEDWTGCVTTVTAKGVCNNCGHHLESEELTQHEFESLRDVFLLKCVQRDDIFLNTSPQELAKFQRFLRDQSPFDVVLDGLNIALMTNSKQPYHQALNLLEVVRDFSNKGRLLVCGRKHMRRWPQAVMTKIQKLATVFFAEDISNDDPFMLYAAFHSGPHTLIVTHDMLRDHRVLLPPEHKHNFNTWQRTHHVNLQRLIKHRPTYYWPSQHDTRVQWTMDGCHMPFEDHLERASHEQPTSWVCLQKRSLSNTT